MVFNEFTDISTILNLPIWLIVVASIWTIIWKGLALWKAAGKKQMIWFVVLLIVNTLGILEILYYYVFSEIKLDEHKVKEPESKKASKKNK